MFQRLEILEIFVSLSTFEINYVLRLRKDRITNPGWLLVITQSTNRKIKDNNGVTVRIREW